MPGLCIIADNCPPEGCPSGYQLINDTRSGKGFCCPKDTCLFDQDDTCVVYALTPLFVNTRACSRSASLPGVLTLASGVQVSTAISAEQHEKLTSRRLAQQL